MNESEFCVCGGGPEKYDKISMRRRKSFFCRLLKVNLGEANSAQFADFQFNRENKVSKNIPKRIKKN